MKNFLTIICIALLTVTSFSVQADESSHTYGTEDTAAVIPFSTVWEYSATQQIFSPSEVGITGNISGITIYSTNATGTERDIEIYIGTTYKNIFQSDADWIDLSTLTKVYNGKYTLTATIRINFDQPYLYDGTKNLVLFVHDKTGSESPIIRFQGSHKPIDESKCLLYLSISQNFHNFHPSGGGIRDIRNVITFHKTYGIYVGGVDITANADRFTTGLASGYMVYDPNAKTLTLNHVISNTKIDCEAHTADLTIISVGDNDIGTGDIRCPAEHKLTITGTGTLNTAYINVIKGSGTNSSVLEIKNTTVLANIEERKDYGIYGWGKNEYLIIDNATVKVFAWKSAVDEFKGITLNHVKITKPEGAVVDNGYIKLNGECIANDTLLIEPDGTATDIKEYVTRTFSIYPNPAETEVNLHLEAYNGTAHMSIISAEGRIVSTAKLPAIEGDYRMNVANLAAGVYYISIVADGIRQTATLIKK